MVAAPLQTFGVDVDLPDTSAPALPTEQEEPLTITLSADGRTQIQTSEVADGEIVPRLQAILSERASRKVFLRADGTIPYARVAQVMGALERRRDHRDRAGDRYGRANPRRRMRRCGLAGPYRARAHAALILVLLIGGFFGGDRIPRSGQRQPGHHDQRRGIRRPDPARRSARASDRGARCRTCHPRLRKRPPKRTTGRYRAGRLRTGRGRGARSARYLGRRNPPAHSRCGRRRYRAAPVPVAPSDQDGTSLEEDVVAAPAPRVAPVPQVAPPPDAVVAPDTRARYRTGADARTPARARARGTRRARGSLGPDRDRGRQGQDPCARKSSMRPRSRPRRSPCAAPRLPARPRPKPARPPRRTTRWPRRPAGKPGPMPLSVPVRR